MNEPCPSAITSGLPHTGAARNATSSAVAAARIRAEASSDTVEQSTRMPGLASPLSSPPSPSTTSSRSRGPDTITYTTSQSASATMLSATRAPRAASGAVLAGVRFQTMTGRSAPSRRLTIAVPIRPVPSQPILPCLPPSRCVVPEARRAAPRMVVPEALRTAPRMVVPEARKSAEREGGRWLIRYLR